MSTQPIPPSGAGLGPWDPHLGPPSDPAQAALGGALRASFNVLRLIMILLLLAYALSGWFKVDPGEQGLMVRFGTLRTNTDPDSPHAGTPVFDPGWHWALPDPFDEKIHLTGQRQTLQIDTFLFDRIPADRGKPLHEVNYSKDRLTPGVDGAMFSGDKNLSHGLWRVEYRIDDGAQFVSQVGESPAAGEPLLRRLTENAIVRTVSGRRVEEATRTAIAEVTAEVRLRLQRELDRLGVGLVIERVLAETIEPGAVQQAFRNVGAAENEKQLLDRQAEQERARILNEVAGPAYKELLSLIEAYGAAQTVGADSERLEQLREEIDAQLERAGGQVAVRLREAKSRATEIRESVRREYEQFTYLREAFKQNPALTRVRLWVEMRDAILSSKVNEVFFVPDVQEIQILTNRDPNRAVEADIERYKKRYEPAP